MEIVVAGSSGLIGSALVTSLREDGHTVRRLVRRDPAAADELRWDPTRGEIPDGAFATADAVVNLAGAGIGDKRWTTTYKQEVLDSRVNSTSTIARALAACGDGKPRVLVSASAVGWYGDRGDDILTESEPNGEGFLAEVVRQWEAATAPASDAGVRVVRIRTGIVMSPSGGALGRMRPIFKAGLGGRLGSGKQWVAWIALVDEVAAIKFVLRTDSLSGAVNLCAPNPVTNRELTHALGRAVHRPAFAVVPRAALKVVMGEFTDEGLLASQRAVPHALLEAGFEFAETDLDEALAKLA